jgi:hypothetical protein
MKHFLQIIFLIITFNCIADGAFYLNKTNNFVIEDVQNNHLNTISSELGKTYYVNTNNLSFTTSTNGDAVIIFSNDVVFKLNENTLLQIDSFDQNIQNLNSTPETIKYVNNTLNCSFATGELELVVNGNVSVHTSVASIAPKNGKYFIKTDEKTTTIVVGDGEVKVSDVLSKKEQIIKTGEMLVVTTAPKLVGRAAESFRRQNIFTVRKIEDDESKAFVSTLNATQQQNSNIRFVIFDKKIVGVKID